MAYLLDLRVRARYGGRCEAGELALPVEASGGFLPCGASARWQADGADAK